MRSDDGYTVPDDDMYPRGSSWLPRNCQCDGRRHGCGHACQDPRGDEQRRVTSSGGRSACSRHPAHQAANNKPSSSRMVANVIAAVFVGGGVGGGGDNLNNGGNGVALPYCRGGALFGRTPRGDQAGPAGGGSPRTRILVCGLCGLLALALAQMYASMSLLRHSGYLVESLIHPRMTAARPGSGTSRKMGGKRAAGSLPYHVNSGVELMPLGEIKVAAYAQEDYDDVHDEVLRKIKLHERKLKKKPHYKFPREQMGALYNRSREEILCAWKQRRAKWLDASTPPFDESPTVARYFLPGPFIGGRTYDTCVVVSNAGDMLNSSLGGFVDSHEIVFRLNDAPTERYEKDVGGTTSVRILNNNVWRNAYDPGKDRDMGFHTSPMYHDVVLTVWEACLHRGPFSSCLKEVGTPFVRKGKKEKDDTLQPYFRRRQEFPDELFYFMNPEMLWDMWDLLQYFSPVPIAPRIPSTGFLAIFVALWHCKLVDLVGFTPTVRFQRGKGGDHYFDRYASGEWGSFNLFHPKVTEMSLLYRLNTLSDSEVFVKGVMRIPSFLNYGCDERRQRETNAIAEKESKNKKKKKGKKSLLLRETTEAFFTLT